MRKTTLTGPNPRRPSVVASLASVVACVLLIGPAACSPKGGSGISAQSPERQSETEYDLSVDLFKRGQTREALDHARKAVELNEENAKALYFTATLYLSFCAGDRGLTDPDCRMADAEKSAKAAVKADDSFRDAKNLLGVIYTNEKKYHDAILVLEPLTKDPAYTESYLAWGNLGLAQLLDGQLDASINSLKNSVTQPQFCVGFYRLGLAYEKKNDLMTAEKSLSDSLAVQSPDCQSLQDAWEARGRIRAKLGRADDAKKDFERCRELSKDTPTGKACVTALSSLAGGKQ